MFNAINLLWSIPHKLVHPSNMDILDGVYSPPANTILWFNVDLMFAGILLALVKWRPSWILHTVQCLNYSLATQLSQPYQTNGRSLNREAPSILCRKLYQLIVSTLHKWRPSWSLLTIRWLMYVLAIPLCQTCLERYGTHQIYDFAIILSKMISIYYLTWHKWLPSWIVFTVQYLKHFLTTLYHYVRNNWNLYARH